MPGMIAGWKFFPVTKMFLYGCVPLLLRGIAGNVVTTTWSVIFSWVVHNIHSKSNKKFQRIK